MNGAKPEAEAKMSNSPKSNSTVIIGINHQSFRAQRKDSNSPTTPRFDDMLRKNVFISLVSQCSAKMFDHHAIKPTESAPR
jgi:hypothetical protein